MKKICLLLFMVLFSVTINAENPKPKQKKENKSQRKQPLPDSIKVLDVAWPFPPFGPCPRPCPPPPDKV